MSVSSYVEPVTTPEECEQACIRPEGVIPLLGQIMTLREAGAVANVFSLLADPTRLRILHALALADELCVYDIAALLGASQSAVSHQLRTLRNSGVVARRREGRIIAYRLVDDHIADMLRTGLEHVREDR